MPLHILICSAFVGCRKKEIIATAVIAGMPVAFKTVCAQQYMESMICPPDWNRVQAAIKTWREPILKSKGASVV